MIREAYIEALAEAYDLAGLKAARAAVAINLATKAGRTIEINMKSVDGRETSGISVTTYDEKINFLSAVRAAIARKEGKDLPESSGIKSDFSQTYVDP
ncbi:MAG: hypothetical protein QM496_13880 [Verrucomicrobiota bacterium]